MAFVVRFQFNKSNLIFLPDRIAPKSANFISFLQHVFITVAGLLTLGLPFNLGSYQVKVPIRYVKRSFLI